MKPVELEIVKYNGERYTSVIYVDDAASLTEIRKVAVDLLGICKLWKQVRVGVGNLWSNWINK